MSFDKYCTEIQSEACLPIEDKAIPSPASFNPNIETLHIACTTVQPGDLTLIEASPHPPPAPPVRTVAIPRRHIVVHGPSCGSDMQCDQRGMQAPVVTSRSVGLPRAHIVRCPQNPARYDLNRLWARPLSSGPLVGEGDRVWLEGIGEVVLGRSSTNTVSSCWRFFSASTADHGLIELATTWGFVRLTSEEYEIRANSGSIVQSLGTVSAFQQEESFLDLDDEVVWYQRWGGFWREWISRFVAIFLHRAVGSAA